MGRPPLWDAAVRTLLIAEGGYVHDPRDSGGETKYGISKRSYPHLDIPNLTPDDAAAIYRKDYWERLPEGLTPRMRWFLFDCAVNHGVGRALEWMNNTATLEELVSLRVMFYTSLSTFPTFGKGWMRRVAHLLEAIAAWEGVSEDGLHRAEKVVLHDLSLGDKWRVLIGGSEVLLTGNFFWRNRGVKLDVRRGGEDE